MMEGREFLTPHGDHPFRVFSSDKTFSSPMKTAWRLYNKVTELHWFTKQRLCWVGDVEYPVVIFSYKAGDEFPYYSEPVKHGRPIASCVYSIAELYGLHKSYTDIQIDLLSKIYPNV